MAETFASLSSVPNWRYMSDWMLLRLLGGHCCAIRLVDTLERLGHWSELAGD